MLEKLSFFSSHNYLYKILANQFGEAKAKEQFVMDNLGYISQDDSADYTIAKR